MKKTFAIMPFLYCTLMFAQDHVSTLKLHYRDTWATEYDIQIEITQIKSTDNFSVSKTINHKEQTTFEIDWSQYYKILLEINKLEKAQSKQKLTCADGNSLLVSVINGKKSNDLKLNCIYTEGNSEGLNLLNLIKQLK